MAVSVTYASSVPAKYRVVSDYAIGVIELALTNAGMKKAVITSTIRSAQRQAEAMYSNAVANLSDQFAMYGPNGDAVLKVFADNDHRPRDTVIALMVAKIDELTQAGKLVSNHVVTEDQYAERNVIDIGVNSTKAVHGAGFNIAKLTKAFRALEKSGHIAKFIDETKKSNHCWHLEVTPGSATKL